MYDTFATIPLTKQPKPATEPIEGRYRRGEPIDDYVVEKLITKHDIAEVYSARGANYEHVAIKVFYAVGRTDARDSFASELNVAVKLHHENVLEFLKVGPGATELYIITPFCEDGTLADWLQTRSRIAVSEAHTALRQILLALACTHAHGIVHGDLKPSNIVVSNTSPLVVKITDFDCASLVGCAKLHLRSLRGSPLYAAPEQLLRNAPPTPHWDMYSVGAIIPELVTGIPVFRIEGDEWPLRRNEPDLRILDLVAPELSLLTRMLFNPIPGERPSAAEALQILGSHNTSAPVPAPEHQFTK